MSNCQNKCQNICEAATILPYLKHTPVIHESAFIAAGARIIGNVTLGKNCSVWFNAVVRGDCHSIIIGENSNIQDGAIVHPTEITNQVVIGTNVTVGHMAIIHGCNIGNNCLIGMQAVVMDGAEIGEGSIIGAGAIVTQGTKIPPNSMVLGAPGKVVKTISAAQVEGLIEHAEHYVEYAHSYIME